MGAGAVGTLNVVSDSDSWSSEEVKERKDAPFRWCLGRTVVARMGLVIERSMESGIL